MVTQLRAIETVFGGYRFRSRVEARWAVFLSALHVSYEYEKEGFNLGESGLYLPDFYLTAQHLWLEIKGTNELSDDEMRKITGLRDHGQPVLLACGSPAVYHFHGYDAVYAGNLYAFDIGDSSGGASEWGAGWCFCQKHGRGEVAFGHDGRSICDGNWEPLPHCKSASALLDGIDNDVARAMLAARQARFEHGESGSTLA